MLSLTLPIYKNEPNLPALLQAVAELARQTPLEAVFVVDGSPDRSAEILAGELPGLPLRSRLVLLSRNFGSFAAIMAGFEHGTGDYYAMLAADLQEPPELVLTYVARLSSGEVDIVVGQRTGRHDPWLSRMFSSVFWGLFRKFAVAEIPPGGVDTFACTRRVRDHLLGLREVDSSLVSLLFWLGFRREVIPFVRRERTAGKSAWSFRKKLDYAIFSLFNFTDLPIRLLMVGGALASLLAAVFGVIVLVAKLAGLIPVPGYTPLALLVSFFGGTTAFGLGVIGQYVWLALQNTRRRPNFVVRTVVEHDGTGSRANDASADC